MIVYGDPQLIVSAGAFSRSIRRRLDTLLHASAPTLDQLRSMLVMTGQLEQAVHDVVERDPAIANQQHLVTHLHALTLDAARAFHIAWSTRDSITSQAALLRMSEALASPLIEDLADKQVDI